MRLTCPNCDAQYEVNDAVIPEGGRDVQCSNCGHTWFQASAEMLRAAGTGAAGADDDDWDDDFDDAEEDDAAAVTPVSMTGTEMPEPVPSAEAEAAAPAAEAPGELRRRTLDDAVLNVLREEAERETRARQAEGSAIETQGDLGLAAPSRPPAQAIAPVPAEVAADTRGGESVEALVSRATRRELLPDIEEINSTLRATSERGNEPAAMGVPETLRQRRSGFRRGFATSLVVMLLLLLPYLLADPLAGRFPAIAPALARYSGGIDTVRLWMDAQMRSSTQSMRDSASSTN